MTFTLDDVMADENRRRLETWRRQLDPPMAGDPPGMAPTEGAAS
jgi:hypothetical protein